MKRDHQRPTGELAMGHEPGTSFDNVAMKDGATIRAQRFQRLANSRISQGGNQSGALTAGSANLSIALLALAGVILPQEVQISFGAGARLTAGRIAVVLLLVPAILALSKRGRRFILCDFLAFATAAWMIVASASSVGASAIPTAGGEVLDFLGGYLIARAYFSEPVAIDTFIRVLKVYAIIAIVFGLADSISGRMITHETFNSLMGGEYYYAAGLRNGWVRAASTFDHPILFGVFCALTAAILLYREKTLLRRSVAASICLLGCLMSQSSASLMTWSIIMAIYTYDRLMRRYSRRWTAFWAIVAVMAVAFFSLSEHPLGWIISHLTLDPQTGYWRILIWDTAFTYIGESPIVGYAYQTFNNYVLDGTVDSIWLVLALRFGIPMIILFALTNIAAISPSRSKGSGNAGSDQMRHAFSIVLLMFMFTGLTVHFWNFMLMFWGLCLGIRASFRERA
jgi:hypothetical protein